MFFTIATHSKLLTLKYTINIINLVKQNESKLIALQGYVMIYIAPSIMLSQKKEETNYAVTHYLLVYVAHFQNAKIQGILLFFQVRILLLSNVTG